MYASHSPIHTHIHTPTAIGCHARYQPARQEQLGVRCLAQGHFDTPRVGSNRQPSDCQTTALPPEPPGYPQTSDETGVPPNERWDRGACLQSALIGCFWSCNETWIIFLIAFFNLQKDWPLRSASFTGPVHFPLHKNKFKPGHILLER